MLEAMKNIKWTAERAFAEGVLGLSGLCALLFIFALPWSTRTLGTCVWASFCVVVLLVAPALFVRHMMRKLIEPIAEKDPNRFLWIGGLAVASFSMQFTAAMAFDGMFNLNYSVRAARVRAACVPDHYSSIACKRALRMCGPACLPR